METIVLGLSGGVDSAVAARLLQRDGYAVHGLYLDIGLPGGIEGARQAAEQLGIPLEVADIREELEQHVCRPFADAYLRGKTPNPCILCNPTVKFPALLRLADKLGVRQVATGHYAVSRDGGLYKGRPANDQSYMLCRLTRSQLARIRFPLGDYEKTEVRALASELGLAAAQKPDSMEICFIPDKDYAGWIARRAQVPGPGDFVFHGEVIGRHEGIHRYTVGQRRPGLYQERKLYVSEIRPETNEIVLALWEELFKTQVRVREMNWLIDPPRAPLRAQVKVRHTKWEMPACTVTPLPDGGAEILCDEPVRAPAPGQAAALYDGERLLGGGWIV